MACGGGVLKKESCGFLCDFPKKLLIILIIFAEVNAHLEGIRMCIECSYTNDIEMDSMVVNNRME